MFSKKYVVFAVPAVLLFLIVLMLALPGAPGDKAQKSTPAAGIEQATDAPAEASTKPARNSETTQTATSVASTPTKPGTLPQATQDSDSKNESEEARLSKGDLFLDEGEAPLPKEMPWVTRRHYVSVNRAMSSGEVFSIKPFGEESYEVVPKTVELLSNERSSLVGEVVDTEGNSIGTMTLAVSEADDGVGYSGRIALDNGKTYLLAHDSNGRTIIEDVATIKMPTCANSETEEEHAAHAHTPGSISKQVAQAAEAALSETPAAEDAGDGGETPELAAAESAGDDRTVIRVLFAYTPQARSAAGGTAAIEARVVQAVADANLAYTNSGINIRLELAYTHATSYNEVNNFNTELHRLTAITDGYMDEIHDLRDAYAADAVALLIQNWQYCGLAWVGPYENLMFGVTNQYCAGFQTFAHELGHNQGAMHAPGDTSGTGKYSYSYGHRWAANSRRSIMAYQPGTRRDYFSSPLVSDAGFATGTSSRDNARTLNNTAETVANYRGDTYSVTGTVQTSGGAAVSGVTISGGTIGARTTEDDGSYSFGAISEDRVYTLTPSKEGYTFIPASITATLTADAVHNFTVNLAPTLAAIPNQQISGARGSVDVTLSASDDDGPDAISYSVTFTSGPALAAYQLDQEYNFYSDGNFAYNYRGQQEKYFYGSGKTFYILPSGAVHEWTGTIAGSPLLGMVPATAHADLNVLFSASMPGEDNSVAEGSFSGNQLTVGPKTESVTSFGVIVSASDGVGATSQSFLVTVQNSAPTIQSITSLTMSPNEDSRTISLSASDPDGDTLSFSAIAFEADPTTPYGLNQIHGFYTDGNYYQNYRGYQEKYFYGANTGYTFFILPGGQLYRFVGSIGGSTLLAELDSTYYSDPTLLFEPDFPPASQNVSLSVSGSNLTITPANGFRGSVTIQVEATDGAMSSSTSFSVSIVNTPPTLNSISDKVYSPNTGNHTVAIQASDADGDTITLSASISSLEELLYQLDQTHNFNSDGNYYLNYRGQNEKYFFGNAGTYVILPNGTLQQWGGSFASSTTLATLPTTYYNNPAQLFNVSAPASTAGIAVSISGSNLVIEPEENYVGVTTVTVIASDGDTSASTSFQVTISNVAPELEELSDVTLSPNSGLHSVELSGSDANGDTLTYSAAIRSIAADAYQLDQTHNFYTYGNYYYNYRGAQEKYFGGAQGSYFILPSGAVYQWTGSIAGSVLLAELSPAYFNDPTSLFDVANPGGASPATLDIQGDSLRFTLSNGFVGSFIIRVTVSDGIASDSVEFTVNVENTPPVIAAINDVTTSANQAKQVSVSLSDADGDSLSSTVEVTSMAGLAYSLDQVHNFSNLGSNHYYNYRGAQEKYIGCTNGTCFILPNGAIYQFSGSIAGSSLIGELDESYHQDPFKLFNVAEPGNSAPGTVSISGSTITVTPANNFVGSFIVLLTVSDGHASTSKSFKVFVENSAPVLQSISDVSRVEGQGAFALALQASDADNNNLTYSALVSVEGLTAYQLDQAHNFYSSGNYYYNYRGYGEKYLVGDNGSQWYFILPNGNLYIWAGTIPGATLVGSLGSEYHSDPTRLFDVPEPNSSNVASVSISGSTLTVTPANGFTGSFEVEVRVSDGMEMDSTTFSVTVSENQADVDSDGDGVSNEDEIAIGTDPFDSGSFHKHLRSPVYTTWNSFLSMINILELVNPSPEARSVLVSMYGIDGSLLHAQRVVVPGENKLDLILNDFPGFTADSYGIVKLEFVGVLDGHVFFYKPEVFGSEYQFTFGIPFANPNFGNTAVGFNTFQPSLNPADANNVVSNWLSIINLDSVARLFTVKSFDQNGVLLLTREIRIPGFGRVDLDGGHGFAGASAVGLHLIEPALSDKPYLAQIVRYGARTVASGAASAFDFAFPLAAMAGNGQKTHVFISDKFNEENWVEIANTLDRVVTALLEFKNKDGDVLHSEFVTLDPFAQRHFNANQYLPEGEDGTATITPEVSNSIIAQSMFYLRSAVSGSVEAMFGSQARAALGTQLFGSHNLFLDMDNWLRVSNPDSAPLNIEIVVNGPTSTTTRTFTIPGDGSLTLPLHDATLFGTAPNTYGVVVIRTENAKPVFAELLRLRNGASGVDFAAPTVVR